MLRSLPARPPPGSARLSIRLPPPSLVAPTPHANPHPAPHPSHPTPAAPLPSLYPWGGPMPSPTLCLASIPASFPPLCPAQPTPHGKALPPLCSPSSVARLSSSLVHSPLKQSQQTGPRPATGCAALEIRPTRPLSRHPTPKPLPRHPFFATIVFHLPSLSAHPPSARACFSQSRRLSAHACAPTPCSLPDLSPSSPLLHPVQ